MKSKFSLLLAACFISFAAAPLCGAQTVASDSSDTTSISIDRVVDRAIDRERDLAKRMGGFSPLIETYVQDMELDQDLGAVPKADKYFLGKLDLSKGVHPKSLLPTQGWMGALGQKVKQTYSVNYIPEGFAETILVGPNFDRDKYDFAYVRREFLGEVRCIVFDVQPKVKAKGSEAPFVGRIWVEDRDYNIVRFNGTHSSPSPSKLYFHFDSWRENMGPGLWLPAYIYTEESDFAYFFGKRKLRFKGQTRLWGYNVGRTNQQNELTSLTIETGVRDETTDADTTTPVEALRSWERQAEDNVLQRLELAGLLAPDGPVDRILETVLNNLEITNNLDIQPPVRARVLLTTPVESFTVGHTVVLSRGFIDVLPDEASLALVLAHELAHISLGHGLDTKYAFNDRTLFPDEQSFKQLSLQRSPLEEADADKTAIGYLKNSPYKDKLGTAALFLRALDDRAPKLPGLLRPHLGNQVASNGKVKRMADLIPQAPELQRQRTDQIAALPLGGRIRVDLWNNSIELVKAKAIALQSAREKMPFEVTPIFLYLTRQQKPSQAAAQSR